MPLQPDSALDTVVPRTTINHRNLSKSRRTPEGRSATFRVQGFFLKKISFFHVFGLNCCTISCNISQIKNFERSLVCPFDASFLCFLPLISDCSTFLILFLMCFCFFSLFSGCFLFCVCVCFCFSLCFQDFFDFFVPAKK